MSTPLVLLAAAAGADAGAAEDAVTVVDGMPTRRRSVARGTSSFLEQMARLADVVVAHVRFH